MAVFPDRIVLKNSANTEAEILAAIETGGEDEITQGELVIGLLDGGTRFYTKDANGDIVWLGGAGVGPLYINDLLDVDTTTNPPTVDQTLVWDGTNWVPGEGGSSDVVDLDDLGDVVAPNPSTGQILEWNGSNWVPADPSATIGSIDDLTDVDTSTFPPTDGQSLVWIQSTGQWSPVSLSGGGGNGGDQAFWGGGNFTTGVSDGNAPDGGEFTL